MSKNFFEINVIPHTLKLTNLKNLKINDAVNVELDIFSKDSRNESEPVVSSGNKSYDGQNFILCKDVFRLIAKTVFSKKSFWLVVHCWYTGQYTGQYNGQYTGQYPSCLLYTSPSPRDATLSRMPSSA